MRTPWGAPTLRERIASQQRHGGNVGWVVQQFPGELRAATARSARARTLLIVVADADDFLVSEREAEFELTQPPPSALVLLIPKRHIETWLAAASGRLVSEEADCKPIANAGDNKKLIRDAARAIHAWAHGEGNPQLDSLPSLERARSPLRRIG